MKVATVVIVSLVGLYFCHCSDIGGSRNKRFIIFDGSGVVKFVAGTSYPIQLVDKQRSLSYFYNFQAQYTPPPRPLYWWSLYNSSTFAAREGMLLPDAWDASRAWLYSALETLLERTGLEHSACLSRAICEVTRLPFSPTSLYSELLNALLIPRLANVARKYLEARDAGQRSQANCLQTYAKCDKRLWNWFSKISRVI